MICDWYLIVGISVTPTPTGCCVIQDLITLCFNLYVVRAIVIQKTFFHCLLFAPLSRPRQFLLRRLLIVNLSLYFFSPSACLSTPVCVFRLVHVSGESEQYKLLVVFLTGPYPVIWSSHSSFSLYLYSTPRTVLLDRRTGGWQSGW